MSIAATVESWDLLSSLGTAVEQRERSATRLVASLRGLDSRLDRLQSSWDCLAQTSLEMRPGVTQNPDGDASHAPHLSSRRAAVGWIRESEHRLDKAEYLVSVLPAAMELLRQRIPDVAAFTRSFPMPVHLADMVESARIELRASLLRQDRESTERNVTQLRRLMSRISAARAEVVEALEETRVIERFDKVRETLYKTGPRFAALVAETALRRGVSDAPSLVDAYIEEWRQAIAAWDASAMKHADGALVALERWVERLDASAAVLEASSPAASLLGRNFPAPNGCLGRVGTGRLLLKEAIVTMNSAAMGNLTESLGGELDTVKGRCDEVEQFLVDKDVENRLNVLLRPLAELSDEEIRMAAEGVDPLDVRDTLLLLGEIKFESSAVAAFMEEWKQAAEVWDLRRIQELERAAGTIERRRCQIVNMLGRGAFRLQVLNLAKVERRCVGAIEGLRAAGPAVRHSLEGWETELNRILDDTQAAITVVRDAVGDLDPDSLSGKEGYLNVVGDGLSALTQALRADRRTALSVYRDMRHRIDALELQIGELQRKVGPEHLPYVGVAAGLFMALVPGTLVCAVLMGTEIMKTTWGAWFDVATASFLLGATPFWGWNALNQLTRRTDSLNDTKAGLDEGLLEYNNYKDQYEALNWILGVIAPDHHQ